MRMTRRRTISALAALVLSAAPLGAGTRVVDDALLTRDPSGADWAGYGRQFDQQRFSPLEQVNTKTIERLRLAWSLDLPEAWAVATVPLEANGVLYFAVDLSKVYAVDAASGRELWRYDAKVTGPKMRLAWGIRGLALWKELVFVGTQDGRLVAIRAKDGTLAWETQTTEPGDLRYITGAPLVFGGKVLIGHGGADFGPTRGYVTAYDAASGKQLWRFYTVPGDPSKPFENEAMRMAAKTWTGEWWKLGGGGTVWNAMTYDPELDLVYLGTGNGAPWNRKIRSPGGGDNLFLCSIVALDAKTGVYRWHYQTSPGETWDYNSSQDMILATLEIDGRPRKVILHAPKNGFFYVIDRENGRLISAEKFAKVTWAEKIDLATGRPVEAPNARYENGQTLVYPSPFGAHIWQPMSFSPDTGLAYIPGRDVPGLYDDRGIDPKDWFFGKGATTTGVNSILQDMPREAGVGWIVGWDPLQQKEAWRVTVPGIAPGGTIVTHGRLVFTPRADGRFVALDALTGAERWSFDMQVGSQSTPVTYAIGGKQYVSILAGWAGQPMLYGSMSAQFGWVGRSHPRRLLTFALDGKASLPPAPPTSPMRPIADDGAPLDPARIARGKALWGNCVLCHGVETIAGGYAPDLRASTAATTPSSFAAVVRGGPLETRGMPKFGELTDEDVESIRSYVRSQARAALAVH